MILKIKKILAILIVAIMFISNLSPLLAASFTNGQTITLEKDHDCTSLLKFKGEDKLKGVAFIVYKDSTTGKKQPAFCVEPDQEGIGTGAGDSYNVTLNLMKDQRLWRALYKGYMGTQYTDWGLDCSDDLYYATKTAVHCLVEDSTPNGKYEVPNRVGWGEDISLSEVQRRGAKVLETAQAIYDYAVNGTDNYLTPEIYANKNGNFAIQDINGIQYLIQNYSVTGNREIESYNVSIANFPTGTKILNSSNTETNLMSNGTFKIAIPTTQIVENTTGTIYITNAKVKTYPVFFAKAYVEEVQDYIIYADSVEDAETQTSLSIDAYKSGLQITKVDADTGTPLSGVTFDVKYADTNEKIGTYTTNTSGIITISGLRQGTVIATETSTKTDYILNTASVNITLKYNEVTSITIDNSHQKGNIKVTKIDQDNNEIRIPNVEFQLLNSNKEVKGTYKTDNNGEIYIEGLRTGIYYLRETKENSKYYPLKDDITIIVKNNETSEVTIQNEKLKGQIKIIKVDEDYNDIKIDGAEFEIINSNDEVVETIKTDSNGEATTSRLPIGKYRIREISTESNYILDEQNEYVTITKDTTTNVTLTNKHKLGNLKIFKIDKDNNKVVLGGVEFYLYSEEFDKVIGQYTTNADGEIFIENLRIGNYKLIEKSTNKWYDLIEDTEIEIEWDTTINTIIENELKKGQVRIIKVDQDNNEIKLEGVKFNILDDAGNILETLVTDEDGEAISKKYQIRDYKELKVQEIETIEGYKLDNQIYTIELEPNQITTITLENEPIKLEVTINKTGFTEADWEQNIYYEFENIENKSNIELDKFIWTEYLPTEAVTADKLFTGTWNQDVNYAIWYKTNKNDYKILEDNLSGLINNEISFKQLNLEDDEYITEYELRFENVKQGFKELEKPRLYCDVKSGLENGYVFKNITTVRGAYGNKIIEEKDSCNTIVYHKKIEEPVLPRTGN